MFGRNLGAAAGRYVRLAAATVGLIVCSLHRLPSHRHCVLGLVVKAVAAPVLCSALQGLLRKLGANFEDMLPMGVSGARMKVRQAGSSNSRQGVPRLG